jgi:hypothetical protein
MSIILATVNLSRAGAQEGSQPPGGLKTRPSEKRIPAEDLFRMPREDHAPFAKDRNAVGRVQKKLEVV